MRRSSVALRLDRLEDRCNPVALDPTFGTGGSLTRVLLPELPTRLYTKLEFSGPVGTGVGPDGTITLVVHDTLFGATLGTSTPVFQVVRLSADGKLDPSFGQGGIAFTPFPLPLDPRDATNSFDVRAVTRLADGRLLVQCLLYPGRDRGGPNQTLFVRLLADGRLDTTYGQNGVATLPDTAVSFNTGGGFSRFPFFLVGPDGGAVVAEGRDGTTAITAVSPGGVAGPTRLVELPVPDGARQLLTAALAPDGKVLLGGFARLPNPSSVTTVGRTASFVMRVNPDGTPDPTFGTAGVFRRDGTELDQHGVRQLLAQPDGSVVYASTGLDFGRLTPAGVPDPGFGGGDGEVHYTSPAPVTTTLFNTGRLIGLSDGRIVAVGVFGNSAGAAANRCGIIVLRPDGTLDPSFAAGRAAAPIPVFSVFSSLPSMQAQVGPANRLLIGLGVSGGGSGPLFAVDLDAPNPPDLLTVRLIESTPPDPAIPAFGQPVLTQTADLTGDGSPDRVEIAQAGGSPRVRVTDGASGRLLVDQPVYEDSFIGGMFAAAADLDHDGKAELIVSPDVGGGARVRVLTLADGALVGRDDFFAVDDPAFRGGGRVAAGDVNGDGVPDLVVGAGFGGGPRVAVYDGRGLLQGVAVPPKLVGDFFAFPGADAVNLRNGVFLSAGDLDGDGKADLAFGGGPGGAPRVFVLSGAMVAAGQLAAAQDGSLANFFVDDDLAARGGARVAVADLDGDGKPELLAYKADPTKPLPNATNPIGMSAYRADAVLRAGGKAPASSISPDQITTAIQLLGVAVG